MGVLGSWTRALKIFFVFVLGLLILEQLCNAANKLMFHAGTFTAVSVVTTTMLMLCPTCAFLINKHETYRIRMKHLPVRSNTRMFAVFVCVACSCAGGLVWYTLEIRRTFVAAKQDFSDRFCAKIDSVCLFDLQV